MGILALLSFNMLWGENKGARYLNEGTPSLYRTDYYGYSLPFPSNILIVISGVLAVVFSFGSLNVKVQGMGTAVAGIALLPPIYSVVNVSSLVPEYGGYVPGQGFFLGVALCIALLTLASFFVVNWKFVPIPHIIASMGIVASNFYCIERAVTSEDGSVLVHFVDYGFPFQWLRYAKGLFSGISYTNFSEHLFLFDVIIWLIIAWLLLYISLYFFKIITWEKQPIIT